MKAVREVSNDRPAIPLEQNKSEIYFRGATILAGAAAFLGGATFSDSAMAHPPLAPAAHNITHVPQVSALRASNTFDSTFEQGSRALELHKEIEQLRRGNARIPSELVIDLFNNAATEEGTRLQPQFIRYYASRHQNNDPEAAAILKFLIDAPYITASETFLTQFWDSRDSKVLSYALILSAHNLEKKEDRNFFEPFIRHESHEVRAACVTAMLSKCVEPAGFNGFELVKASVQLPDTSLSAGNELRIALALNDHLLNCENCQIEAQDMHAIKVPLLHTLQRIDGRYPELLDHVHSAGAGCFDDFCLSVAGDLLKIRKEEGLRTIIDADTKVYIALHYEEDFTPFPLENYLRSIGVKDITSMKAGKPASGDPGVRNRSGRTFSNTAARREYLENLKELETPEPKKDYLEKVRELSADNESQTVVWHLMHGGPDHFWFYSGNPGQEVADDLHHPFAVSHKELATNLFFPQYEKLLEADDKTDRSVSFGHMTFVLDSCRQYTVAEGCISELIKLADENNVELKSTPTFVSLNQKMMYGELNVVAFVQTDEHGRQYEIGESVISPFNIGLKNTQAEATSIQVNDFYPVERSIAEKIENYMKDADRLAVLRDWNKRDEADEKGLRGFGSQDPAIFSSNGWNLDQVVKTALLKVNEISPDLKLPLNPEPREGTEAKNRILELAEKDRNDLKHYS